MLQNGTLNTWNLEINCLDLIPGSTSCYHVNLHKLLHLFVYLFPHLQIFKALLIYYFIKAETPILWPLDAKSWLTWKDHDARKDWTWEEKGITEDEMVGWHHQMWWRIWVNSGNWWWTGMPGMLQSMGSQSQTWLSNWTELNMPFWLLKRLDELPFRLDHGKHCVWVKYIYILVSLTFWIFDSYVSFIAFPVI